MADIQAVIRALNAIKLPDGQVFQHSGNTISLVRKKQLSDDAWADPVLMKCTLATVSSQCGGLLLHSLIQSGKIKKEVWLGILEALLTVAAFAILTDVTGNSSDKRFLYYKKLGTPGMEKPHKNPNTSNMVNIWVISSSTVLKIKQDIKEKAATKSKK